MPEADAIIAAVLRGENPPWPREANQAFIHSFLRKSAYHGVQPLVHHHLLEAKGHELGWPKSILEACKDSAFAQAMWEMRHKAILGRILERMAEVGVRPLLFKGAALGYRHYPAPFLRTRGDTDLLIPEDARERACEALESIGFECALGMRGDLISYTAVYNLEDPSLGTHEIDLHWRISNSQVLSKLFSYDELTASVLPLPALSPLACAPSDMYALAIACMHRAGHKECPYFVDGAEYYGGNRLIWFYDMHLICKDWEENNFRDFLNFAERKGLASVCLDGLEQARKLFGSGIATERLKRGLPTAADEQVSIFLEGSPLYQLYANVLAVDGARDKLRFLWQVFFPPEKYMRAVYGGVKPDWLLWLHVHRLISTIGKKLNRTFAHSEASRGEGQGSGR